MATLLCCLYVKTEIPEIFSDQEETDTRVILYCAYAQKQGYETVRIRSPDSDIFFILLHHASKPVSKPSLTLVLGTTESS